MAFNDAGLAHEHWKKFYTPEEVDEILRATVTTTIVSCGHPIHVRIYLQSSSAPTVIMACPMLPYGLLLARLQLPFYRAGFNVVQWDLPGWGQSGGPRAGCPVTEIIQTWLDIADFATERFDGPFFAVGLAEDSITCYYAYANDPRIQAISLHTLLQYGDPRALHWQGSPFIVRLKGLVLRLGAWLRPGYGTKAEKALPWTAIFSGSDDGPYLQLFADDPLRVRVFDFRLAASMVRRIPFPVPLEQCRTPIQLLLSEKSSLWPPNVNLSYFNRIGGPKKLISLGDVDQWVYTREFMETFAGHCMNWFREHGAFASVVPQAVPVEQTRARYRAPEREMSPAMAPAGPTLPVIPDGHVAPRIARLHAVRGTLDTPDVELTPERELTIGRDGSSDIQLPDGRVSRQHARILNRDGQYLIVDLNSSNGVLINGQRIEPDPFRQVLRDGDRIAIGSMRAFEFVFALLPGS